MTSNQPHLTPGMMASAIGGGQSTYLAASALGTAAFSEQRSNIEYESQANTTGPMLNQIGLSWKDTGLWNGLLSHHTGTRAAAMRQNDRGFGKRVAKRRAKNKQARKSRR